jgi:hypothetical protein
VRQVKIKRHSLTLEGLESLIRRVPEVFTRANAFGLGNMKGTDKTEFIGNKD